MQVIKDPLKTKGARLSMELAIPGRYMVYAPHGRGRRRVAPARRQRARAAAQARPRSSTSSGGGAIIRTAAHGATPRGLRARARSTCSSSTRCSRSASRRRTAPALVFQEADLSVRVVRDIFSEHFERAIVDDPKQHQRLVSLLHAHRARARRPRRAVGGRRAAVRAPTASTTVIEGDALAAGRPAERRLPDDRLRRGADGDRRQHRLATPAGARPRGSRTRSRRTNLEAAEEVVRQLRLRDIGGIIVIDFIDMARARNRDAVLKTLRKALDEDRTKTFVVEISPLGLVEMTRQNVTDGVREIMTKPCPTCDGEGVVRSEETIAIEVERSCASSSPRRRGRPEAFLVQMNPRVTAVFTADGARMLHELEAGDRQATSTSRAPRGSRSTTSRSRPEGTREEIEERALPFREGEEVLVDIVEPHMYNVDDAVAKIDGYVIAVTGGDRLRRREEARADRGGRAHGGPRRARRRDRRGGRGGDRGAARGRASARPSAPRPPRARAAPQGARGAVRAGARPTRGGRRARSRRWPTTRPAMPRRHRARPRPPRPTRTRRSRAGGGAAGQARSPRSQRPREPRRRAETADAGAGARRGERDEERADGDAVSSKPRRRGRRGGRRRSRAKADAGAAEVSEASE